MKLWSPKTASNNLVETFTVGNDPELDQVLVQYDCRGSIAHAKMFGKIGLLSEKEVEALVQELEKIIELDERGEITITQEQEDCHTAIEQHLTEQLGDTGKKIHTGRSRNDQVVTALRLYYKDELSKLKELAGDFGKALSEFSEKYGETPMPGYTHTRKAMPSSVGMWAGAYISGMQDNQVLLDAVYKLVDQSPLGTGAGYGVPLDLDREFTAKELGFEKVQENPIAVQNSRGKYESSILHVCSQVMADLNRMASDLILFSESDFSYFELPMDFCTGSSIMPQKKNPDVFELVRAKYHQILGWQTQIQSMAANLISGYHRDLQLTKEPVMRGLQVTEDSLEIITKTVEALSVNPEQCQEAMTEELYATERAYDLVKKGMPFRDAYREISKNY